jgi:hypothetical protein
LTSTGLAVVDDEIEIVFRSSVDRNCFTESLSNDDDDDDDDNSSDISIISHEDEEDIEQKPNIFII